MRQVYSPADRRHRYALSNADELDLVAEGKLVIKVRVFDDFGSLCVGKNKKADTLELDLQTILTIDSQTHLRLFDIHMFHLSRLI